MEEPRRAQANTTSGKSPVSPIKDVSCQDIVGTLSTTNNPPPRGNLLSPLGKIRRRRTPGITDAISTNPVFTQEGADSSIDGA